MEDGQKGNAHTADDCRPSRSIDGPDSFGTLRPPSQAPQEEGEPHRAPADKAMKDARRISNDCDQGRARRDPQLCRDEQNDTRHNCQIVRANKSADSVHEHGGGDTACPFADRVRCGLYLGDWRALDAVARDGAARQSHWCVVTVLSERDLRGLALPRHVDVHHIITADDDLGVDLTPAFAPAHAVIASAMARGKSVLVHCMGGISRSTTILAAHLILQEGLSAAEAVAVIRKARRRAGPNASFWRQLKDLAANVASASALSLPADAGHA
nr:dual specificity phosphatase [Pandoravirus massiliensis]